MILESSTLVLWSRRLSILDYSAVIDTAQTRESTQIHNYKVGNLFPKARSPATAVRSFSAMVGCVPCASSYLQTIPYRVAHTFPSQLLSMLVEQSNRSGLGIDTTRLESSSLAFLPPHVPLSSQNNGLANQITPTLTLNITYSHLQVRPIAQQCCLVAFDMSVMHICRMHVTFEGLSLSIVVRMPRCTRHE